MARDGRGGLAVRGVSALVSVFGWRSAGRAALLVLLLPGQPVVAGPQDSFIVVVTLTPAAAERLTQAREGVIVSAWYYADPKKGSERRANPVGLVDVGTESVHLDAAGGEARVTGDTIDPAVFGRIGGPLQVNVNVWSARESEPANLLACDFFDGLLSRAQVAPVELRCGLIAEGIATEVKS